MFFGCGQYKSWLSRKNDYVALKRMKNCAKNLKNVKKINAILEQSL